MSFVKISLLWKNLENALSLLTNSSQIWLLEKFLEEADKSELGREQYGMNKNIDIFLCLGKAVKEETTILNLKTEFAIKDPKRKQRKKRTKKNLEVESAGIKKNNAIKAGNFMLV
jgi:hypothetical protein